MLAPDIAKQLVAIGKALKPLGIRWYVFGAQAVIAAGVVRQTADIDITVEDIPVTKLRATFKRLGFVLRDGIANLDELIEHHRILPLEHKRSGLQLDVVRAGPGPETDMLARVIKRRIGHTSIPYVDTNDLVVLKVLAGRPKDLEDIRALLRSRSTELQLAVIRHRLREMQDLLDDSTLLRLFETLVAEST